MATDTTVNSLIINKLTKAQYDAIQNKSETELYLVPDEIDTTPTSGSENPVTSGGIYTALSNKQNKLTAGDNIIIEEIPENYSGLEYIQTSGTQYIDTGIIGHMNYTYEIDFQQTTAGNFRTWGVLGQNNYVGLNMSLTYSSGFAVRWESRSGENALISLSNTTDTNRHKVKIQNGCVYYDGSNEGVSAGHNENTVINYNIFLGTINPAGGSVVSNTSAKFYSYKVWNESGGLIQNLIPVKDASQVVGMYDTVTGTTLYNSGTGNFISGPDTNGNPVIKVNPNIVSKSTASIPYGVVDSTSTATVFTATIPGITALEDGVCVFLRNGVISSTTGCTLNINGLGAKPIYNSMSLNTRITTAFNVNYTYLFVYNSTVSISGVSGTGAWCVYYGYNGDSTGVYLRTNNGKRTTKTNCGPYRILFSSPDDTQWIPATTSTVANAADLRDVTTEKINPFGRIVYYSNSAVSAGDAITPTSTLDQYPFTFGYSFNRTGGTYYILTTDAPVYIKCTPQDDDTAIIDSTTPYVQTLPSTEDGKIYIYLGRAYSTQSIELEMHHPVYYYKDNAIRLWTGSSADEDISRIESVTETALSDLEKKHQRNVKRIEDLEDGFEAVYDDIERIESAIPKIELDEVPTSGSNNAVTSGGVYSALSGKQDTIDSSHKLSADLVEDGTTNKVYTATEKTKLSGIAAGAEVNVQADWNQTTTTADDYIKNKPSIPTKVSDLTNDSGFISSYTETDPIFSASAASGITSTDITGWNNKVSNVQSDWSATSGLSQILNKPTLATVATSGSYDDLSNRPNPIIHADITYSNHLYYNLNDGCVDIKSGIIPTVPTNVSAFTNDAGYLTSFTETDPIFTASAAHGITSSDISNWNSKTSNVGTITGITMNGVSKGTSGVVDLGTVITAHQDISGKADKSAAIGSLSLSLDSTNYRVTLSGTKVDGTSFTVSDVIDLPLESVVVNGSYNNTTKKVVLTLQSGSTVEFSVADLVAGLQSEITSTNKLSADLISDGTTNKTVTQTEKTTWNSKGTYSKPSGGIPKTDLASAVQTSLGLADTAVQSVTLTQNSSGTTVSVDGGTATYLVSDASRNSYVPGSDNFIAPSWNAVSQLVSECNFRNYLSSDFRLNPEDELALSTSIENAINSISGKANSADLATVATSGSYNDLSNKPTIPAAQIQSDWNQTTTTAKDYIKNKPTALTNNEIDTIWNNVMT